VIVVLLCTLTSRGQLSATDKASDATNKLEATGTVTGHVYLNDTKGPARKATVSLQPVTALLADVPPDHGQRQADGEVSIGMETNFDGSFSFSRVAAGCYYVIASYPGYISPYLALSLAEGRSVYGDWQPLGSSQKAAKELVLKSMPRIDVEAVLHEDGEVRYVAAIPSPDGKRLALAAESTDNSNVWLARNIP
jgi:hypothetical protein